MADTLFKPAPGAEPVPGYCLVERLGSGGYGEVWQAMAPGGFPVALKFVALEQVVGAVELRALDLVRDVRHPNLLTTFGAWQTQGLLVIAMELADRTLMDRFREAVSAGLPGIPHDELLAYFQEVARGIDFLNEPRPSAGGKERVAIQHRDIKPQNILLVGDGVKVADFGLARVMKGSVTGHNSGLTTGYAAPEFFEGRTTRSSDQYSLGITYCQMRGGRLPFEGTPAEIMAGHLQRLPNLSMLPPPEQPVVARALAKDPKTRWPSCRAFVEALCACASASAAAVADLPTVSQEADPRPYTTVGLPERPPAAAPLLVPAAEGGKGTPPPALAVPGPSAGVALEPQPERRRWIIGRAPDCDLVVNQLAVSAQHCCLIDTGQGFFLEDLRSSNGTYVNGRAIHARTPVRPGDRITLGQNVPLPWPSQQPVPSPLAPGRSREQSGTGGEGRVRGPAKVLTIGRAPNNDVVLDYPMVSANHARITLAGAQTRIEDLASTNGTALGRPEHKITQAAPLAATDVVFFGSLRVPAARLLEGGLALGETPCAVVAFGGRSMVFGRDPGCDQVLNYPMVSGRHARLWRAGAVMWLEDLHSSNGTFLDGQRVARPVQVQTGAVIGLGSYTFKLTDQGNLEQRDFRGNVALEARAVSVAVPGRRLLEQVSLTVCPGELVGLMGPSGAGKTTLLSALNGYTPPAQGEVLLNGYNLYEHYARFAPLLGYVPQDDILHHSLTVGQALYYSARLRLPADYRPADVQARVVEVLRQLGLEGTEDVLIGSPERRGISGGQRKRVNLAMELLTDPLVLYLDEPTSGLSSEDALLVVRLLRALADAGRTILLTIHQPGPEVFRLLDNLAVVARDLGPSQSGRLVYYGPAYPDAVRFFNPAGAGARSGADLGADAVLRGLSRQQAEAWQSCYRASAYCREYVEERAGKRPPGAGTVGASRAKSSGGWAQWRVLVLRCLAIKVKDHWNTAILLVQAPVIAALIILVYGKQLRQEVTPANWLQVNGALAQTLFLAVLSALWFGCINAVREVVGEWAVYRRERMVGLGLVPYVASKCSVLGLLCLAQCAVLGGAVYWGGGMTSPWLPMAGLLLLVSLVGVVLGLVISAAARTSEVAIAVLPLVLLPMIIFGGVLQPMQQMHRTAQLACQFMPTRWAFEGMLVLEAEGRPRMRVFATPTTAGRQEDMAERYFPEEEHRQGPRVSALVLAAVLALLLGLIYLVLRARDGRVLGGRLHSLVRRVRASPSASSSDLFP